MGYHSDPTADRALGSINREFARLEKRAERICEQLENGTLSPEEFERAHAQFRGVYRHVLDNVFKKREEERARKEAAVREDGSAA